MKNKKIINTELGVEKFCKGCQEYYPLDSEFYKSTNRKTKNGIRVEFQTLCKSCYKAKYRSVA